MSNPDDIPQDAKDAASHVGMSIRMMLSEIAPRKAASLWGTQGVIHEMNKAIARAIMTAKAEAYEDAAKIANEERVLPFYVNPEEATEPDKAYDMAIDHVIAAIRTKASEVMK